MAIDTDLIDDEYIIESRNACASMMINIYGFQFKSHGGD